MEFGDLGLKRKPPEEDPVDQSMSSRFWQLSAPQIINVETALRNTEFSAIS